MRMRGRYRSDGDAATAPILPVFAGGDDGCRRRLVRGSRVGGAHIATENQERKTYV